MVRHVAPHPATLGPARRRRGRAPTLSRPAIADAALAVGFERMTVTAVARRLGVSHAALYGHVRDRDDLVLAAADRLVEITAWPEPAGAWRAFLEAEAWALWGMFAAHPGMTEAASSIASAPTALASRVGTVAAHLLSLGFGPDDALTAADTVFDLALDTATRGGQLTRLAAADRHELADQFAAGTDPRLRPTVVAALTEDPARWFARKLRVVLTGIEACLAPPGPDAGGRDDRDDRDGRDRRDRRDADG